MKGIHVVNKYHAIRTTHDGITFDSKREAARYTELRLLERAGEISGIIVHPAWPIIVNGIKVCTYEADFSYWDVKTSAQIIEDVKTPPTRTRVYRLKKKLLRAVLGIEILEV